MAKRLDSRYEPGSRSGAWRKMRINQAQEYVIGGYTLGAKTFDALIFGCYEGGQLSYVARTRNGFTPALRKQLFKRFRVLEIAECPFANLPRSQKRALGARPHCRQDEGVPLVEARAGGAGRVRGMDTG